MKIGRSEFTQDNLTGTQWIGIVEDTEDPKFEGRIKVRVYGKFDGRVDPSNPDSDSLIPTENLPWARPANILTGGSNTGGGRLDIPKIGSEIQFLQAKSNYEAQQAAVNQLQQQISKTTVRAPFSGTIDDVITEQGTVVAPGQSMLFRLVNLNNMHIETDVPESYLKDVTPGKHVEVYFPVLSKTINAKVRQAGDFINPANRTFKVEIAVPNKDRSIKPNLTAKLKINDYTNETALLNPQSIISENAEGEQYIYLVKNKNNSNEGIAERVIIETGKTQGDVIEVLKGIENGAEIIQEGARSVKNGQTVKVLDI